MRATYAPAILGTRHIFSRQGLSSFSANRRRTVSRERLSCAVRRTISPASSSMVQQARPLGGLEHAAVGRAGARGRYEECFLLDSEFASGAGTGLLIKRLLDVPLHEAAL